MKCHISRSLPIILILRLITYTLPTLSSQVHLSSYYDSMVNVHIPLTQWASRKELDIIEHKVKTDCVELNVVDLKRKGSISFGAPFFSERHSLQKIKTLIEFISYIFIASHFNFLDCWKQLGYTLLSIHLTPALKIFPFVVQISFLSERKVRFISSDAMNSSRNLRIYIR